MAKQGPNKHTNFKFGNPDQPGWYATKAFCSDFRWHTNVRRVRRYWNGSSWSIPVTASYRNRQDELPAMFIIDHSALGRIMYSALRNPR